MFSYLRLYWSDCRGHSDRIQLQLLWCYRQYQKFYSQPNRGLQKSSLFLNLGHEIWFIALPPSIQFLSALIIKLFQVEKLRQGFNY